MKKTASSILILLSLSLTQGWSEFINSYTDQWGITYYSNGITSYTDEEEITYYSNGKVSYKDQWGITHYYIDE